MTPTPKEGPPTPRECKKILSRVSNDGICWCALPDNYHPLGHDSACRDAKILFARLTDEALERDEKRRAALERKLKTVAGNVLSYLRWQQRTTINPDLAKYEKQIMESLDALTPALQEKESAK